MITVRKLQLTIINEDEKSRKEQYRFIRDSQYAQYKGLNRVMGYLMSGYYNNDMDFKNEGFIQHQKSITNSMLILNDIEFGKGIDSKSAITQKVKKDFKNALKSGLAKGEMKAINYKRDFPLMTRGRDLKFSYESENEDIIIKWVNKITFKVVLSKKHHKNYVELQHFLRNIINNTYKIGQSSFEFNKNNKLILNLNVDMPEKEKGEFVEGRVVGVDLGMKIPAYVSLNDLEYVGEGIGCIDDLLKVKKQFDCRNSRMKKRLVLTKGGHGRKQKLRALKSFTEKEKNYVKTYNHLVSKRIIDFAKKYNAPQINMELLSLSGTEKESALSTIRWWGYYQLQTMIEYKAEREGIIVRYVDPYHTSQTCSICGHYEKGQRPTQEKFICKNEKCGHTENADRNASRNIAKSTKYITKKEEGQYYKNKTE